MAENAQQLFINAQAAAQLAVLPTFSKVFKDNKFTPMQKLQKFIITKLEQHGQMSKQSPMSGMHALLTGSTVLLF